MRIMCAVCRKTADRVETWSNPPPVGGWTLIVQCHGDEDRMTLSDRDAIRLGPEGLRQIREGDGVAFTAARIAHSGEA